MVTAWHYTAGDAGLASDISTNELARRCGSWPGMAGSAPALRALSRIALFG
jgi:hypothetical protein